MNYKGEIMAERKNSTRTGRTRRPAKRPVRRRRLKKSGHPLLFWLIFMIAVAGAAYMTDRMTNEPGGQPIQNVTAIHHLFNDKEEQGVVPSEDAGSPKSLKERIKAAVKKITKDKGNDDTETETSITGSVMSAITGKKASESESSTKKESVSKETSSEDTSSSSDSSSKSSTSSKTVKAEAKAPAPAPARKEPSPSTVTGRLAVVIDDAGRDLASQEVYESIGVPFTLAVMPNQVHTREAAASWAAHGMPVILHQPMESVSGSGMEAKTILTSMSDSEIRRMLSDSLSQVPEAVGINNHQGSKATTDKRVMDDVMNELHHRGLFFLDSATNSYTEADGAAAEYGVPYARNDLFVDNSSDVSAIKAMIREAAERAKEHGTYIIIGHCRPHTAEAFRQMVPQLEAEGIKFIYVSSLMN